MIQKDPQNKDFYLKNAADYNRKLSELDHEYQTDLGRLQEPYDSLRRTFCIRIYGKTI